MKQFFLFTTMLLLLPQLASAGWIKRADLGAEGRHRGAACATDSRVYAGFGHYNGTGFNYVKNDWWEYDPATNAWTQRANHPETNGDYDVCLMPIGSKIYMCGGVYNNTKMYEYTPQTNTWTQLTGVVMPTTSYGYPNFVLNGKGYIVVGGSTYEFDPQTLQWTAKTSPPMSPSIWGSFFELNDNAYILQSGNTWEYKPSTDQWIQRAPFPGAATGSAMCFEQGGKGYVVSGWIGSWNGELVREVWEYDPLIDTWTQLEDFPGTSRKFAVACTMGDRSFLGIGTNGTNFNDFWEFDADLYLSTPYLDVADISVYPNPAVEKVTVELDGLSSFSVELYDALGNMVQTAEATTGSCELQRGTLAAGQYSVRILANEKQLETKTLIFY